MSATPAVDWLAARARLSPTAVGIVDAATGAETTYAEWNARVDRTAGMLRSLGVGRGDRVAVYSENRVAYVDLIFACGKIGAITQNLNWRLTVSELAGLVTDAAPRLLAFSSTWAEATADLLGRVGVPTTLALDEDDADAHLADRSTLEPAPAGDPSLTLDDPWGIYYTGGTTGLPKGAVLTHGNVLWNSINTVMSWGLHAAHAAPVQLPLFHIGGPNIFLLPLVHVGGRSVVCAGFDPDETLDLVDTGAITHYVAVPTMYRTLQDHPRWERTDWSRMELVISGGAPCPEPIMRRFWERGVDFKVGYGLTEASGNNFWLPPEQVRDKPGWVGHPLFHVRAAVVDERGSEVAPGTEGELVIAGPHVMSGYWNAPEATAEAIRNGWLHTGDTAIRDADGAFRVVGRSKEMYISGGENVYPAEVESVLAGHPAVEEVAVVGVPDDRWGEVGAAFVAVRSGAHLDREELIDRAGERLARYKLPRHVVVLDELPKTAIGKHDKKAMVRLLEQGGTPT